MHLRDLRILITGGASGIGLALATRLVAENQVVVASRDTARLRAAVAGVHGLRAARLDVASEDRACAALAEVVERLGGLDLLVNAAGVLRSPAGHGTNEEIAVNLVGALRMTRLALPRLRRASDGAVVFVSSPLVPTAAPGPAARPAIRTAVHVVARSLRAELAGQVKVFDVLPPSRDGGLAPGLGRTKLVSQVVAAEVVDGLWRDRFEIRLDRVEGLATLVGIWPAVAVHLMAREHSAGTRVAAIPGGPDSAEEGTG
jgi:uncharacterized oxidoreductase